MSRYTVTSLNSIGQGSYELVLEPVRRRDQVSFRPGQYVSLSFYRDGRPSPARSFTIAAAPDESGQLSFGFRVTGDFTASLSALRPGDDMMVRGPFGRFLMAINPAQPVIMLAGGIGITPFMSQLRHAAANTSQQSLTLLFSSRNVASTPYWNELAALQQRLPRLRLRLYVDDGQLPGGPQSTVWPSTQLAADLAAQSTGAQYLICGPGGYMKALVSSLHERGVAENQILTESFAIAKRPRGRLGLAPATYALSTLGLAVGVVTIGLADVNQYQQKVANAQAATAQTTTTATPTPTPVATAASTPTPAAVAATPVPVATVAPTPVATPTRTTYQPPVSTVS